MESRRAGLPPWILVLIAVAGVVAGITTARLAPGRAETPPEISAVNDPLELGVPLVSRRCTGETLRVLGVGDSAAQLTVPVSLGGEEARYLRTDESCGAFWSDTEATPKYVVYLGPYDDPQDACASRLSSDTTIAAGQATQLDSGSTTFVQCGCVLSLDDLGVRPADTADPTSETPNPVAVATLQRMLNDSDALNRLKRSPLPLTGVYQVGNPTYRRVLEIQRANGFTNDQGEYDGGVGARTWNLLRSQVCGSANSS